jgi:hypothetical protein
MAIELHIDDGSTYWYMSPDIWVVPSDDPNDPPGIPYANVSAYVWARVHNRGTTAVENATVRYYWANPSTIINDQNANLIGTSSVSLAAGQTREVLCVTQWLPQWVNDGHECLVAEAFAATNPANPFAGPDPLPPRAVTDAYQVVAWRQMAQKNLDILRVGDPMMKMLIHPFMVANPDRERQEIRVIVRRVEIAELKEVLVTFGFEQLPGEVDGFREAGLQPYRCGDQVREPGEPEFTLELPGGHQQGMALVIPVSQQIGPDEGAMFVIEQMDRNDDVIGGVGALVLGPESRRPERDTPRKTRTKAASA